MSDFYRNQPDVNDLYGGQSQQGNGEEWDSTLFQPQEDYQEEIYDDMDDASPMSQEGDPYAAWRRPDMPGGGSFLMDEPAPFGAELQQGGLPLFNAEAANDEFLAFGDDAPTRLAQPVQMVNKRTSVRNDAPPPVERPSAPQRAERPAPPRRDIARPGARVNEQPSVAAPVKEQPQEASASNGESAAPRRRSRVARRAAEVVEMPAAVTAAPVSNFDPFDAGDSEINDPVQEPEMRRAAVPGGRYTGARTAVPTSPLRPSNVSDNARVVRDELIEDELDSDMEPIAHPAPRPAMQPRPMAQPNRAPAPPNGAARRPIPQSPAMGEHPTAGQARRPVPSQGAAGNRPVAQQPRTPDNRPMPPQGMPGNRPVPPQGMPGNRPVPPQGMPAKRPASPQGMPANRPQQAAAPARRPAQQGGRQGEEAFIRKQMPGQEQYAYRAQQSRAPYGEDGRKAHASVNRKPYEFENQEEEEAPRRKGGALVPIVIVLLVLGGALAGICLPDWDSIGGGLGNAISPIKSGVVSAFASVKNMIAPEEDPIKSFAVATSDIAAPATLRLTVQTSRNITGIRVADDNGNTIYNRSYDAQLTLSGEAIENSNALIWTPSCTIEDEYTGGFTVYAVKQDGTESEGVRAESTVAIAAPKPTLPPIQSFTCDVEESPIPVDIVFSVVTSADVTAVRVVDQYDSPVVSMAANDLEGQNGAMAESGDIRTWTLNTSIDAPYTGNYAIQYQTASDELNYVNSDYTVYSRYTQGENGVDAQAGQAAAQATAVVQATAVPTTTVEPVVTVAPTPTPAPTPEPTPEPTQVPDSTPLPALSSLVGEAGDPNRDDMRLNSTVYVDGKTVQVYSRSNPISILNPFTTSTGVSDYAIWRQAGVLTFRSGPMRQNAAYGTVDVQAKKLSEVWSQPVGSMRTNNDTLYGVNSPGQPVIVKWATEVRQRMALNSDAKAVTALKEVIVAGQDGKIYFYNLLDGTATREPINIGAPSAGGLSIATNGTPILGVGQSHSRLRDKTVNSGYHIYNLLNNEEIQLVRTDGRERNSNYSGVLGAALFDADTGTMIFGSQGGLLYTVELGEQSDTYDYAASVVSLSSGMQQYKATARGQDEKTSKIDASVAMYNNYAYFGDEYGLLQCVDVNTMTPVWAHNMGDNIDATPALDMEDESTVALYAANTVVSDRNGVCTIKRINALTGAVDWSYDVADVTYQSGYDVGIDASPVVGQKNISNLVIFTAANGANGSSVIALNKKTGIVEWQTNLSTETVSSPVAIYNENGDAWIIQALFDGQINLLDGSTGQVLDTLKLNTEIKGSPAVYGNLMVIGSTGRDTSNVYCIKID